MGKSVLFTFALTQSYQEVLNKELGRIYQFRFAKSRQESVKWAGDSEVLVMKAPLRDVLTAAVGCKWIHVLGVGVEEYISIDGGPLTGSVVTNSSGIYGPQVSEHVFAMLLSFTRRIKWMILDQERRRWGGVHDSSSMPSLRELDGLTIGIIGLGNIGLEIARRSKAFGLRVTGVRRSTSKALRNPDYSQYVDKVVAETELDQVLDSSDVVVNTLPLTRETRGLFNSSRFSKFKKGSIFINVGRGQTVVENHLVAALNDGRVGYAGLDVFEEEPLSGGSPLWKMENVIISPHCAGWSSALFDKAFPLIRENLIRYSEGQPLRNAVDLSVGY